MVLSVCVCSLYTGIPLSRVVSPTDTKSVSSTGTRWIFGDPNWVFPIGIFGKGEEQIYPLGRFLTHPYRALGAAALGKNIGKLFLCRYHISTSI